MISSEKSATFRDHALRAAKDFGEPRILDHRHDPHLHEVAPHQREFGQRNALAFEKHEAAAEIGGGPAADQGRAFGRLAAGLLEAGDRLIAPLVSGLIENVSMNFMMRSWRGRSTDWPLEDTEAARIGSTGAGFIRSAEHKAMTADQSPCSTGPNSPARRLWLTNAIGHDP
jgi:hypothetical protein